MKRILALVLVFLLVLPCALPAVAEEPSPSLPEQAPATDGAAYNGTPADKWYIKKDIVVEVSTAEELVCIFMDMSSNGNQFARKTIRLTADITINDGDFREWEKNAPKYNWAEFNYLSDFRGTFDGNGHTISGIYCNGFYGGNNYMPYDDYMGGQADRHYTGFFFKLGGTVKNLRITNSYFCGPYGTAAIAGSLSANSTFENVQIDTSKVFGTYAQTADSALPDVKDQAGPYEKHSATGAFVGLGDVSNITLKNCVYQGTLVGGGRMFGGLLGNLNRAHVVMESSGFIGTCQSYYSMYYNGVNLFKETSGGLIGHTDDTTEKGVELTNCFFIGNFQANAASTTSGALIGCCTQFTARDCFVSDDAYDKFYDPSKTTNLNRGEAGMTWESQGKLTGSESVALIGLDESVFTAVEGIGPLLSMFSFCDHGGEGWEEALDWEKDEDTHWKTCPLCGNAELKAEHEYDHELDKDCNVCGYLRTVNTGTDGYGFVCVLTENTTVTVDRPFDVYFDLNAFGTPVGSVDFSVLLSDNLEYLSHEILVDNRVFMMSTFNADTLYFGCGMTLNGVMEEYPLLKLTLKATAEGEAKVDISFQGGGIGNLVGDAYLNYTVSPLLLDALLHVCCFDREIPEARYLQSEATCTEAACYYKSCECGEHGNETFFYGDALGHEHTDFWDVDCNRCGEVRTRPLIGDANGDGNVTFADIQRIYQHISTSHKLTGDALIIADANKDGSVTFADIQRIYQHVATSNKLF